MNKSPIILDENFRLEPDGYQWVLKYEAKRKEIDEDTLEEKIVTSSDQWYHGELRFALRAYCDKVLKPEPTVKALWDKIEELFTKIDELFASKVTAESPKRESLDVDRKVLDNMHDTEMEAFKNSFNGASGRLILSGAGSPDPVFEEPTYKDKFKGVELAYIPEDPYTNADHYDMTDKLKDLY